jgi:hypothetical protein
MDLDFYRKAIVLAWVMIVQIFICCPVQLRYFRAFELVYPFDVGGMGENRAREAVEEWVGHRVVLWQLYEGRFQKYQ